MEPGPRIPRAITRNLLHQAGLIYFSTDPVTVTIDPPNQPRVAKAVALLADELNKNPWQRPQVRLREHRSPPRRARAPAGPGPTR